MRAALLRVGLAMVASVTVAAPAESAAPRKQRPDLVVAAVTGKPGKVAPGERVRITEATRNRGKRAARRTVTRYYLSRDKRLDRTDVRIGQRKVPRLRPGTRHRVRKRTARVPASTAPGRYRLLACADATKRVRERNERNNCRVAKRRIRVTGASTPAMPRNGSVKVEVRLSTDQRHWSHSDTPGTAFAHREDTSIRYTGTGSGWLLIRNGKPELLAWSWERASASGGVTYTAQGENTGIAACPLWTAEASLTSSGTALSTAYLGGQISTASSSEGLRVGTGLAHPEMASVRVPRWACGQPLGYDRTLRLQLRQYGWSRPATTSLTWSPDLLTVSYHKRGTVNDPSYSEQGWEEHGTVRLTPVR